MFMIQWNSRLIDLINNEFGGDPSLFSESPFFRNHKVRKEGIEFKYESFEIELKNEFFKEGTTKDVVIYTRNPPLVLKPFQEDILNKLDTQRFNILGMCRQSGASTLLAMHALKEFMLGRSVLIITPNGALCEHSIDLIKKMYYKIPFYMQPGINAWNARSIGNSMEGISAKDGSSLQKDQAFSFKEFNTIIIEGASHIKNLRSLYERIFTEISKHKDSKLIIHSNSTDSENVLFEISRDSMLNRNNFVFTKVDAFTAEFPKEDLEAFRKQMGEKAFAEEFELSGFLKTTSLGIDAVDLMSKTLSGELNKAEKRHNDLTVLETKLKECIKTIEYITKEIKRLKEE